MAAAPLRLRRLADQLLAAGLAQESPACLWAASWCVPLRLTAVASSASDVRLLDFLPSPLLNTRTGPFSFDAPSWAVNPSANAS